ATAHLMRTLFGLHNRDEFEIYCYSYGGDDGSDYRKKIEQDSDKFTDISSLGHIEAAKQIYADKVDILLDLKGHTKNNRIGICALRPAPVQITYLGFPGTSGADFLDYMITDRIVSPPEHRAHFSESFIYMPDCYQVNDNRQPVSGKKYRRADFGLPEKGFVFCSFNQNFKIEPLMFGVWTEILQEVPDSVLWLVWENESAEKNLKREAEKRGISPDRLVFSKRIEKKEHLARHRLADLALDTRIVNGHTTSSDALWAGVPVIAVKGSHFASRVSESILRAVGLSELITENLKEYKLLAIRLALDPGRLKVVKEKLWQNRRTESLFDTPRFVANLEEAYRQVYKNFREGRRPDIIEIRENTVNSNIVPEKPDENRKFNISGEIQKALRLHEAGRIEEADEIYQEILRRIPDHPDALHLSGVAAHQQGEHDKAVAMIEKAIERVPGNPVFYSNLGAAVQGQGDWDRAAACYHKVLDISPENAEAYYNLGNVSKNKGDTDEALSYYQKAIHIKPGYAEAYHNLGNAIQHEKPEEALVHYRKAVELKPDYPQAYNNMGNLFQGRKNLPEAVSCYQKALELKSDYAEAYNNLANIYKDQGRFAQAVAAYRKALELKPELVETLNNLGITLNEQDKKEEALACYRKAAKLRPDYAETFNNMGNLFQSVKKTDEAVRYYKKALAIDPEHSRAYSSLIFQLQHACAWDEIQNLMPGLDRLTRKALEDGRETEEMPFMSMMMRPDPAHNYAVAKSWSDAVSRRMEGQRGNFSFDKNSRARKDKITIAYLSNDFHNHATAHLMRTFFGLHNRKRFEIYAYSYGKDDGSHYRKQIEKDCDRFVDIYAMNHAEAAQCIFRDQVDILIELKGYTKGNRLEICALRPAPVQVSYLGYPGTTGADFIDYIITDRGVSPVSHAPFFSEKFVYMPHTYQVNDHAQPISAKAMKRADFGLPDSSFVLCSFNQLYKTEPLMFDIWMRILRKIPGSVLWLFRGSASAQQNILKEAGARGVNPERIIFAQSMPKDEHLARHRLADLALDTRIVNGHTTTSDALWAGLPVVTLEGTHFASRVSASLLSAVGLPELITRSSAEYEKLVLRLWENPAELENIKKKLAENCKSCPLFDTGRFVRNLEDAYAQIWKIYLTGEKPRQMEIRETGFRSQEPGVRRQESGVRSQESGVRG
ncbi:MAG: tetratricopeptide repeat protein, partial [Desulfococcaceae bacterium]|nr:tetratricopeptide repeat protein [Desulfococcaceae bacterium]